MDSLRFFGLLLLVIAGLVSVASAQDADGGGGQFCVRAFEDINGNQIRDPGEPFILNDLTANLQNAEGVVIATAAIEDSPSRAQGLICFRDLSPGQYSLFVTTATYSATTSDNLTETITLGSIPALLEYGGQRRTQMIVTPATAQTDTGAAFQRVLVAGAGSLAAMVVVALLGAALYALLLRPRPPKAVDAPPDDPDAPFRPPSWE